MKKTQVIVDTCFLLKLSKDCSNIDNIRIVLDELDYKPVIHPYIFKHELLNDRLKKLVEDGYITVIEYADFMSDEYSKIAYENYYNDIYKELYRNLNAKKSHKCNDMFTSLNGVDIYNNHKKGSSMGDVHMILMALFLEMPIILTEDSDIDALREIAERKTQYNGKSIQILDAVDLISMIATRNGSNIKKKTLIKILEQIGEKEKKKEVSNLWNLHNQGEENNAF